MNDFEDIWKPACEKVGVWKREVICERRYDEFNDRCSCGTDCNQDEPHYIPAPALGDAEAVVKMLEWLICPVPNAGNVYEIFIGPDANGYCVRRFDDEDVEIASVTGCTLALALAAAVLDVKE